MCRPGSTRPIRGFFRRRANGERRTANGRRPGFPRFRGRTRWHACTSKAYGNGARLANGFLVLAKLGRLAVRWSRPVEGTPKTVTISKEADGW
jgi:putative transposase